MASHTNQARRARPLQVAALAYALIVAVAAPSAPSAADGDWPVFLRDRSDAPVTVFVARRPSLEVKLWVDPWGIVFTRTGSLVRCEGGSKDHGSITSQAWTHFPVNRRGEFGRGVEEAYEGSGRYFTALSGRVHANRVSGEYRAWEERLGEEEFFPRCGTRSFRGEPMRFSAHRVAGPPWHSAR
jgi:hypothetical protein